MRQNAIHLAERLRLRLWVVPAAGAIVAAVAALAVIVIEDRTDSLPLRLGVDPVSARYLLSAISSAMITFTALVFSVTMLVLQLAASQLSPRVMRTFLRDRFNQVVLALFVATFVFALLLLVSITSDHVPQLGVFLAIVLVLVSILAFVAYIDHMAHAVDASHVITSIAQETREAIDRLYPGSGTASPARDDGHDAKLSSLPDIVRTVTWPQASGYVVAIDEGRIAERAARGDYLVEVTTGPGGFIVRGEPLLALRGPAVGEPIDDLVSAVSLARERRMSQDPGFGFRQLIDIALKALSPSINDQTTADRVIDQLHDLLRMMRDRPLPSPRLIEVDGKVRALVPGIDWDDFVPSTAAEISDASRDLPFVTEHLRRALEALAKDAPGDRLGAIRRALMQLERGPEAAPPRPPELS